MDKLIELITDCLEHKVPITGVTLNDRKDFEFELQGFSKSGTGILTKDDEGNVILKTRYNEIDRIEDFDDIKEIQPNQSGFISDIEFLKESIYFASKLNGSSTTYYKSFYQNGESMNSSDLLYAIYGGSNQYSYKAGPEFLLLANPDKDSVQITTHLIY